MKQELGKRIGEMAARVIVGPRVEGTVLRTFRDPNTPEVVHYLIGTVDGKRKHMIFQGLDYKPGDHFGRNVRGKGRILLPGSKTQRNPFSHTSQL